MFSPTYFIPSFLTGGMRRRSRIRRSLPRLGTGMSKWTPNLLFVVCQFCQTQTCSLRHHVLLYIYSSIQVAGSRLALHQARVLKRINWLRYCSGVIESQPSTWKNGKAQNTCMFAPYSQLHHACTSRVRRQPFRNLPLALVVVCAGLAYYLVVTKQVDDLILSLHWRLNSNGIRQLSTKNWD